jgi:hypothetical protein
MLGMDSISFYVFFKTSLEYLSKNIYETPCSKEVSSNSPNKKEPNDEKLVYVI